MASSLAEDSKLSMPTEVKDLEFQHCFKCCVSVTCRRITSALKPAYSQSKNEFVSAAGERFIHD